MTAEEITKGSTLLATLNKDNFPFGAHKDLIDDLHKMINVALTQDQMQAVLDWMNEWDQLKDTAIPLRFKEVWIDKVSFAK